MHGDLAALPIQRGGGSSGHQERPITSAVRGQGLCYAESHDVVSCRKAESVTSHVKTTLQQRVPRACTATPRSVSEQAHTDRAAER
jgi:hypothetical protein